MSTFTVYSAGCETCTSALKALKSAVAKRGCGCTVRETPCDGQCDAAKRLSFAGKTRPVVVRDDAVVWSGPLREDQATTLLPTT